VRLRREIAITGLFVADGLDFVSRPVASLELTLDGIVGDRHAGATRKAGPREPWHPRGAEIRNDRQLSIVGEEELQAIATAMAVESLPATWLGANLMVKGLPALSDLAPGTRLITAPGAALVVTAYNAPCRRAGRTVADSLGRPGSDRLFTTAAKGRRGLVASVERVGRLTVGEALAVLAPQGRF
jgi:hypothetical protein